MSPTKVDAVASTATVQSSPSTSAHPSASTPTDTLTGFGATPAAWEAHHIADPRYNPGAVYNEDPSLGDGQGGSTDRYYAVIQGPRIIAYDMRTAPKTTIAQAKAVAMREFPPDATAGQLVIKDTCAQMLVHSTLLGQIAGPDYLPGGTAIVEFSSGPAADTYVPSDVTTLVLIFGTADDIASNGC